MADFQTSEDKLKIGKDKKDAADEAFKQGQTAKALMEYHGALLYLLGLNKDAMGVAAGNPAPPVDRDAPKEKDRSLSTLFIWAGSLICVSKVDILVEKIYANMSACHIKNGNWKRALETADKALAKDENNYKAMYRKGKALAEQGYIERAIRVLEDLKKKSTNEKDVAAAESELVRLRADEKEKEKANNKKLKGFLSRDKGKKAETGAEELIEPIQSAKIEELPDDA
ncbi:TPR-like protein [Mycena indigotica]|uniref:TPR-like protein n=1 Tax=Mycena indigotica TaxID=2126181 RepID=A0A8H6WC39_9AGAR|nr:TPR-like protein [Mycena indigotica]KAF7312437.1 TPR-like protein [Mycena indigotica]